MTETSRRRRYTAASPKDGFKFLSLAWSSHPGRACRLWCHAGHTRSNGPACRSRRSLDLPCRPACDRDCRHGGHPDSRAKDGEDESQPGAALRVRLGEPDRSWHAGAFFIFQKDGTPRTASLSILETDAVLGVPLQPIRQALSPGSFPCSAGRFQINYPAHLPACLNL